MSAPRIPNSTKYWLKKDKVGKEVVIYFHDDLDGIFSAVAIKNYLIKQNFKIVGYGVVNYQEAWKNITINKKYVNVAVDFATDHEDMDIYIDHHGEESPLDNTKFAITKKKTSAYEVIKDQIGEPVYDMNLYPIDMVDSASYEKYCLSFRDTMYYSMKGYMNYKDTEYYKNYNDSICDNKKYKDEIISNYLINNNIDEIIDYDDFKKYAKNEYKSIKPLYKNRLNTPRMYYTAFMNQIIKRSCWNTLIDIVHNLKNESVFSVFEMFKKIYPVYNKVNGIYPKDFLKDGLIRLGEVRAKTRGSNIINPKPIFKDQNEFITHNNFNIDKSLNGYQILGNVAFIPNNTWCNAIRARALLEEDIMKGYLPKDSIDFIILQNGNTIQMVCFHDISKLPQERLPKLKSGECVRDIGEYMNSILSNFKKYLGYRDPSTYAFVEDDITVAGGHGGIGTVSNICGVCDMPPFENVKFLDLFKNKIISDISNANWSNVKMGWCEENDEDSKKKKTKEIVINRYKEIKDIHYV